MCKLLYCGRMVSVKLLTRLILLWYNPLTEEDQRLRHCIGVFLQLYTHSHRYTPINTVFVSVCPYRRLSQITSTSTAGSHEELVRDECLRSSWGGGSI